MAKTFPTADRFAGCLVGQCLGDAIAQAVADWTGELCREFCEQTLSRWWCDGPEAWDSRRCQYSEGAQLAVELVRSILEHGDFQPSTFADRIATLVQRRQIVRPSWETYKAAKNLSEGQLWHAAAIDLPGAAAALRAAPLGVFYFGDPRARHDVAVRQSRTTNCHAAVQAGAAVLAEAVTHMAGGGMAPAPLLEQLAQVADPYDASFGSQLRGLAERLDLPPGEAASWVCATVPPDPFSNAPGGIPVHVVPVVLWSLYAALRSDGQFTRAMELALFPGGNVVATASAAGACSGAQVGLSQLPIAASQQLVNGEKRMLKELLELSEAWYRDVTSGSGPVRASGRPE